MKLSPKVRYAIRILLELAQMRGPASTASLAEKTGMTLRTVENIHSALRYDGITEGTVGAKGGITLVTPLSEVSLGRLVDLFDDGVTFAVCCGDKANECPHQDTCATRAVWRKVSARVQAELDAISLESVFSDYPECGAILTRL